MALPRRHGSRRVGCLLGVVFVVLTGAQLARAIPDSEPAPTHPCAAVRCAADGEPVCGINCVTYPNACRATCSLVPAFTPGKCKDDCGEPGPCVCTKELNPVCGSDCVTYSNPCFAFKCGKVPYANPGSCTKDCMPEPPACPCTKELKPVCGSDCVTYNNPCLAKCAKVKSYKDGKCPKKCVPEKLDDGTKFCPLIFDPVCDVEACKTYSNACFAGLAKAGKTEPGECPEDCEPVVKPPKVTPPSCRKEGRPCSPGNKNKDCCSGLKCKGGKCVKKYNNKPDWKHKHTDRSD